MHVHRDASDASECLESRNSSFIAQGSPDHEIKQYHSFRLLCRSSSLWLWYVL